ncbi:DinB family protein [Hyphobacterium sp. CCMP332]|nr:DinB family protein [Hyphobacterium sp. CCMP332]
MTSLKPFVLLLLISLFFNVSLAQEVNLPKEPMASVDIAALYVQSTIIESAEQMPEEYYTFRPTAEVRSFGELMAHIAEANFEMCAIAKGETTPVLEVAPTKTEVIKALKQSFEYSAEARKNMTQQRKETLVKFMGGTKPAGNVLDFSVFHSLQHYGNVIVYMRLKELIPPSSQ